MATDHRIRVRIAQRLGRKSTDFERIDLDPHALPEPVRQANVPLSSQEEVEQEELRRDAEMLHATHALSPKSLRGARKRPWTRLLAGLRGLLGRVLRPFFDHQTAFNGAVARSVSNLMNRTIRHDELLRVGIGALTPTVRAQAKAIHELERRVRILEQEREHLTEARLDSLAFANRFRGDERTVRERQRQYVELFADASAPVLDFGSGRGEFLELLHESGIPGQGVDSDAQMVEHTLAKGLAAELRDGFAYLEGLPPESLGGLFAAQVVEHLELQELLRLLRLARRALAEGGVIVLETHNPQTFLTYPLYAIDPTHVRLYHNETLAWLLEMEGFGSVETMFVDPISSPDVPDELKPVFHGFLTYAAIGRVNVS